MENDPYKESQIHEFLVCAYEIQCFENDKEYREAKLEDYCIKKIDDEFPLSSIFFPAIQLAAELKNCGFQVRTKTSFTKSDLVWYTQKYKDR